MILALAPITPPSVDWLAIAPELALGGAAVLVVLAKALLRRRAVATPVSYVIAAIGIITCGANSSRSPSTCRSCSSPRRACW